MIGQIRTVLGDIPATALGRTDYHEHLFQVTPLLAGDELDDEARSGDEALLLHEAGIDAIIEATPTGLGRDPAATARISAGAGLRVVATTGAHREAHYTADHWLRGADSGRLAELSSGTSSTRLPSSTHQHNMSPPSPQGVTQSGPGSSKPGSGTGRSPDSNAT